MVLGSIIAGLVAPSEAAAVGAVGAALMIFFYRGFQLSLLREALYRTMLITGMVFFVVIGAGVFSLVFRYYNGDDIAVGLFEALNLGDFGVLLVVLAILFVLGFFIDWIEIVLVSLPILYPAIRDLDLAWYVGSASLSKIWIGALVALVLQTSFLTPPFGFALFYLRGVAPKEITTAHIYRGVLPFVLIQVAGLAILWWFPAIVTIVPDLIPN